MLWLSVIGVHFTRYQHPVDALPAPGASPMSARIVRLAPAALVVAITVAAPAAHAQPITVTFNCPNGANDLNLFYINLDRNGLPTSGTGSVFNWSPTAGINDNSGSPGGGLLTNTIDATAAYLGPEASPV